MTPRKEMFWILLLLGLSSVCGLSISKTSLYQVEEGDSITLRWNSSTKTDLSSLHMNCRLRTVPVKKVIYMFGGEEEPQYQDRQFSGRVQCDREALRLGQVQLHLTTLTPQDSGEYQCEMAANYDSDKGGWRFISTEYFEIKVTTSPVKPGADEGNEQRQTPALIKYDVDKGTFVLRCVIVMIIIVGCVFFLAVSIIRPKCLSDDEESMPALNGIHQERSV